MKKNVTVWEVCDSISKSVDTRITENKDWLQKVITDAIIEAAFRIAVFWLLVSIAVTVTVIVVDAIKSS